MDVRLLDVVDEGLVRHSAWVVNFRADALLVIDKVRHVGDCCDDVHVELAVKAFLNDFHVQKAEETASETEAKCHRTFGREGERGIVELQLLERSTQVLKVFCLNRIDACEDHRLHLFEARNGFLARVLDRRNRIADLHLCCRLDAADDVTHVAAMKDLTGHHIHFEHTDFVGFVLLARVDELHLVTAFHRTVYNLEVSNDAAKRVEDRVKDKGLQRSLLVTFGTRDAFHDGTKYVFHTHTCLAARTNDFLAFATNQVHDFVLHLFGHCVRHIALVDDGDDFEVVVDSHVEVANGLSLNALSGIYNKQGTFAGGNASRDFIREVHMSWSVDKVEDIRLPFSP